MASVLSTLSVAEILSASRTQVVVAALREFEQMIVAERFLWTSLQTSLVDDL